MYALDNVKKWCEDNPDIPQYLRDRMVAKAAEVAEPGGVISAGAIQEVIPPEFALRFADDVQDDPAHIEIGLAAIRASIRDTPDPINTVD